LKRYFSLQDQNIALEVLSLLSNEGPYENEYVKIRKNDIVIDAGANMGLFSMYCSEKKIKKVYAFEPQASVLATLKGNIQLNALAESVEIVPMGLSDMNDFYSLSHSNLGREAASIVLKRNEDNDIEKIRCVSLDSWVAENNIPRIDFIKADIEGAERYMLLGATQILKDFSPRLAICTYHLPDDPKVLEKIILKANNKYIINHSSHKLYAFVP
jgi:FkbM family methyltransferase